MSPDGIIEDPPVYTNSTPMVMALSYDEENEWGISLHFNGFTAVVTLDEPHEIVATHHIPSCIILFDCDVIPVCFSLYCNNYDFFTFIKYILT